MYHSTYSFEDLTTVISHMAVGQLTLQGAGCGSITFTMSNDTSSHDIAADGSVVTSKQRANNGTVAITVQQTSAAHKWFTKLYNYLIAASASEWAAISLYATSKAMNVTHTGTNLSIQKRPDTPYQASSQQITWTFLAADLKEV